MANIFGLAKKGLGMLGRSKGKGMIGKTIKDTSPPMIKIKPKPKGSKTSTTKVVGKPEKLDFDKFEQPAILRKGNGATLSSIKKNNPKLYKKYMESLGKK